MKHSIAAHQVLDPPSEPSDALAPVGVSTERVDSYTLQVVEQLFPAPTSGLEFLALLLRLAISKQMAMADMGMADVAEISVQSIRVLASKIGRSYETTHKYVVLFCGLGLLIKSRESGLVKLRFPLCRYQPPVSLQKLDALIAEARPKVVSCALRVRKRFLVLYGSQLSAKAEPVSVASAADTLSEIQDAIADLHQVAALPEANALRERLDAILARLGAAQSRLAGEKSTVSLSASAENGRLSAEKVDSPDTATFENGRLAGEEVDSPALANSANGRLSHRMVDSPDAATFENGRLAGEKSTVLPSESAENGRLSAEKVDFSVKTVDSGAGEASNVNVIISNILDKFNVNVRGATDLVITYLMSQFGEQRGKLGYWRGLVKVCAEPSVWLAATIETGVAMQRQGDPVRDPGRYFYNRVCAMAKSGVSPETEQLVERYKSLSFPQLRAVLQGSGSAAAKSGTLAQSRRRPKLQTKKPHDPARVGMSKAEARELLDALNTLSGRERARGCYGYRLHSFQQQDDSYAVWASGFMDREVWFYEFAGWQEQAERLATRLPSAETQNFLEVTDGR
jgi:hypothetical protein